MRSVRNHGVVVAFAGVFVLGVLVGSFVQGGLVNAQQKFGPEDVKSVPKSFIEGGGKSHTVLVDILAEARTIGKQLERIEANSRKLDELGKTVEDVRACLDAMSKKMDTANNHLGTIRER